MTSASPDVVRQRGQGLPQLRVTLRVALAAAAAAAALRRVDAVDAILLRGGWRPRCDLVATLIYPHRKTSAAAGACGKAGVAAQGRHRRDQGIPRRPHRLPNRRAYHINQACQRVQRADEAVVSQRRRRRRGLGAPAHGGKTSEIRGRR